MGFGVARFDKLGDARASERGTSDKDNSHALFVYMPDLNEFACVGELAGNVPLIFLL